MTPSSSPESETVSPYSTASRPLLAGGTFAARWDDSVAAHSSRIFLVFQQDDGALASWSYAEFDRHVEQVATRLQEHGVGPGDAVHLALRNCPAFVAIWLAVSRLGAWFVPSDPQSSARDVTVQLERTRPVLGVCATVRSETYRLGASEMNIPILEISESIFDLEPGSPLLSDAPRSSTAKPAATDRLAVMFTSGITARPKGVVLTQRNYAVVAEEMAAASNLRAEHRWLVTLPLFHANGQYYCFAPAIAVGASVALTAKFSASRWLQYAYSLRATHTSLFAAPMRMILARTPANAPRPGMQHVWFAQTIGAEHYLAFSELVGCRPQQIYGMTETVAIVTADASNPPIHNSIGTAVGGRIIQIVDPVSELECNPGEVGMIMVEGERGVDLFSEYLADPETTDTSFLTVGTQTWFRTGDLAVAEASGLLKFMGRADDVIKVAGENVSLTEVEAIVAQAPGVLEAAVISRADALLDFVPIAYIVPDDPARPPTIAALQAWAEQELPPQARPRDWVVIAQLPRTSVGKVRKYQINASK